MESLMLALGEPSLWFDSECFFPFSFSENQKVETVLRRIRGRNNADILLIAFIDIPVTMLSATATFGLIILYDTIFKHGALTVATVMTCRQFWSIIMNAGIFGNFASVGFGGWLGGEFEFIPFLFSCLSGLPSVFLHFLPRLALMWNQILMNLLFTLQSDSLLLEYG